MSKQSQAAGEGEGLGEGQSLAGSFGFQRPRWLSAELARHTDLLRLLGRLTLMTTQQIRTMAYPHAARSTFYEYLRRLVSEELIYPIKPRNGMIYRSAADTPLKHPTIYGLTPTGRDFLDAVQAETSEATLAQFKVRDPKAKRPTDAAVAHALQVSWWCSSLIEELRRNRFCSRVHVQADFAPNGTQCMDALVIARFSTKFPRETVGPIPWFDGTLRLADELEIRLALEVDWGTEPLRVLRDKAHRYQRMAAEGVYDRTVGGAVLPVFLVPTAQRARQIAAEWRQVCPDGWGVISTPPAADQPEHGTVWGRYVLLSNLKQSLSLMTEVTGGQKFEYRTLFTLEQWKRGIQA